MKKTILSAVALFCLPIFALADSSTDATATPSTSSNPPQEEQSELEGDDDVQMHCVWTSCAGTFCDDTLADPEFLDIYMKTFDNCYE